MSNQESDAIIGALVRERRQVSEARLEATRLIKNVSKDMQDVATAMDCSPDNGVIAIAAARQLSDYVDTTKLIGLLRHEQELSEKEIDYANKLAKFGY